VFHVEHASGPRQGVCVRRRAPGAWRRPPAGPKAGRDWSGRPAQERVALGLGGYPSGRNVPAPCRGTWARFCPGLVPRPAADRRCARAGRLSSGRGRWHAPPGRGECPATRPSCSSRHRRGAVHTRNERAWVSARQLHCNQAPIHPGRQRRALPPYLLVALRSRALRTGRRSAPGVRAARPDRTLRAQGAWREPIRPPSQRGQADQGTVRPRLAVPRGTSAHGTRSGAGA
jgi:hypothetical protein